MNASLFTKIKWLRVNKLTIAQKTQVAYLNSSWKHLNLKCMEKFYVLQGLYLYMQDLYPSIKIT